MNSSNFNATILKFSETFNDLFSQNLFSESHGFAAMPVTSCIQDTCSNLSLSDYRMEMKLFNLVTENLRIMALTLLELTQFLSPNPSIYS